MSTDRNLLFGIVALQNNLITGSQLVNGMYEWMRDRRKSLGEIFIQDNILTLEEVKLFNNLVDRQLQRFKGDSMRSIRAMESFSGVRQLLKRIPDAEIQELLMNPMLVDLSPADQKPSDGKKKDLGFRALEAQEIWDFFVRTRKYYDADADRRP